MNWCSLLLIVLCLGACRHGGKRTPVLYNEAGKGKVVATIDGISIYESQVLEDCKETGLPPREVLDKMIDEALLVGEEGGGDLLEGEEVERVWKKALVQKILEVEVEKKVTQDSVTLDDIKEYYVRNYEGQGLLLEDVWREIRFKLLSERRAAAYQALIKPLAEKSGAFVDEDGISRLK